MTTLTQLKKYAKYSLIPYMEGNGFQQIKALTFIKEGPEDIKYVVWPEISYGENLKLLVVCITEEMNELIAKGFPSYVPKMVGGELGPEDEIAYELFHLWKVGCEEDATESLNGIQLAMDKYALPFFDSIQNRQDLVNFIYPTLRRDDEFSRIIDKILAWVGDKNQKEGNN